MVKLKMMRVQTLQRISSEGMSHAYQGSAQVPIVNLRQAWYTSDTSNMIAEADAFES